eukprot:s5870_g1.t1
MAPGIDLDKGTMVVHGSQCCMQLHKLVSKPCCGIRDPTGWACEDHPSLVDFIRDHAHLWVETYSGSTNFEQPNKALAAYFAIASWFGAVTQGHDTSNLRSALAADSSRHMVELSFTGCRGFGDDSLQQLLNHLPRQLRMLRLDLAFSGVQSWNFQKAGV